MNIHVVTGANYGDEGKGRAVQHIIEQHIAKCREGKIEFNPNKMCVIRANGGSQAGHTVWKKIAGKDEKFVFSHLGAGTLYGVPTMLTSRFIVNPITFQNEYENLIKRLGEDFQFGRVFVSHSCEVTTPMDMEINKLKEDARGNSRHGSCGLGIFETFERKDTFYTLRVEHLCCDAGVDARSNDINYAMLRKKYHLIASYYHDKYPELVKKSELFTNSAVFNGVMNVFLGNTLEFFKNHTKVLFGDMYSWVQSNTYIFEGAQGLRLSMANVEDMPHLTPSFTGAENVLEILEAADNNLVDMNVTIHYITRPYITRHGAGPLTHEDKKVPYSGFSDATNHSNLYQGHFRCGIFDYAEFEKHVVKDYAKYQALAAANENLKLSMSLVVTCLDHMPFVFPIFSNARKQVVTKSLFMKHLETWLGPTLITGIRNIGT